MKEEDSLAWHCAFAFDQQEQRTERHSPMITSKIETRKNVSLLVQKLFEKLSAIVQKRKPVF